MNQYSIDLHDYSPYTISSLDIYENGVITYGNKAQGYQYKGKCSGSQKKSKKMCYLTLESNTTDFYKVHSLQVNFKWTYRSIAISYGVEILQDNVWTQVIGNKTFYTSRRNNTIDLT